MARLGNFRIRVTLAAIFLFGCWVISYYFIHFHRLHDQETPRKENKEIYGPKAGKGKWSHLGKGIKNLIFNPKQELLKELDGSPNKPFSNINGPEFNGEKKLVLINNNNKKIQNQKLNYRGDDNDILKQYNSDVEKIFQFEKKWDRMKSADKVKEKLETKKQKSNPIHNKSNKKKLDTKELVTKTHNHSQHIINLVQHEPICKIPVLDPWHHTILPMIQNMSNLNCLANSNPYISYVKNNQILLNITYFKLSREPPQHIHAVSCELAFIERITDDQYVLNHMDTIRFEMAEESRTKAGTKDPAISALLSDFYHLRCKAHYLDIEEDVEDDADKSQDDDDYQASYGENQSNEFDYYQEWQAHIPESSSEWASDLVDTSALGLDVIMLGYDSTSRMNFLRKMPKSYDYMIKTLGTVVLEGYNIVGDATTAALIPFFTGHTQRELPDVHKESWEETTFVDKAYPLVWKKFKEYGYVTMYGEDSPQLGWANLRLTGFKDQPTDHYMRHYWSLATDYTPHYNSINNPLFCDGPVPTHKTLTDYLAEFQTVYRNNRKFAFSFATELTHGDINRLSQADDNLYDYLKSSHEQGLLDNTLLIVFGDHGARYSELRRTMQGKLEERLPFVSVTLSKRFGRKHPQLWKNLMRNSKMLLTPFDIHSTLLSLLDPNLKSKHGLSILGEIPWNRTCEDASIPSHWCTCMEWESLSTNNKKVLAAAKVMVKMLNNKTKVRRDKCAELKLSRVIHAEFRVPNKKLLAFSKTIDGDQIDPAFDADSNVKVHDVTVEYELTIETQPGGGLHEASVKASNGKFTVDEDISRINAYGDQPHCIMETHPYIMKFCYCKDLIGSNN